MKTDTSPSESDISRYRVLHWIRKSGGTITRHRLRRKCPGRAAWAPIEVALQALIDEGIVERIRNPLEAIDRGYGPPATRYRLREGVHEQG